MFIKLNGPESFVDFHVNEAINKFLSSSINFCSSWFVIWGAELRLLMVWLFWYGSGSGFVTVQSLLITLLDLAEITSKDIATIDDIDIADLQFGSSQSKQSNDEEEKKNLKREETSE